MDEFLSRRYLNLAGSHGFVALQTDEDKAKRLGHRHRES